MRRGTLALLWLLTSLAPLAIRADDYHLYAMWRPPELNPVGVNGYVDLEGRLGLAGEEYLFFLSPDWETGGAAAFVYRVETEGDPHQHPDNLEAPGPVTARTFTRVSSYTITELGPDWFPSADGGLYVDGSGIYYGALLHGVYHWDFDWTPLGHEVAAGLFAGSGETFAANPRVAGQWWAGIWSREIYRWEAETARWRHVLTHPELGGSHHDGLEIVGDSLFISDMTSDVIIQYRLDEVGNLIDPPDTPYKRFTYSATPVVETMGWGPNKHLWVADAGGLVYELGGGALQEELEPEICDGEDNDGDGMVDEELVRPCQSTCGMGTETCRDGAWGSCVGENAQEEICDGRDNDCDGEVDEGVRNACGGCGPTPTEVCDGVDNDCDGEVDEDVRNRCGRCGPVAAEVCDGIDNDCDGAADEGELCPDGAPCLDGWCVVPCQFGECPAGSACNAADECVAIGCDDLECPAGEICVPGGDGTGACVDPCAGVRCPPGWTCRLGACLGDDCYYAGCPDGQTCLDEICIPDPCADVDCPNGQFCRESACVDSCAGVDCPAGESCSDGGCVPDPCADVTCPLGQACHPLLGECRTDPCHRIHCPAGRQCVDGVCRHDPCANIDCPEGERCVNEQCVTDLCVGVLCGPGEYCDPTVGACFELPAADADADVDADTDSDADGDTDADSDADGDVDSDGDADGDVDGDADADGERCSSDRDCSRGQVCEAGRCTDRAASSACAALGDAAAPPLVLALLLALVSRIGRRT